MISEKTSIQKNGASESRCTAFLLFLVVSVDRVVGGEVEAATLLTLQGPAGDEITHIDHVAQFADVLRRLDALEEALGLFVEHIETVPGTVEAQVEIGRAHV